MIGLAVLAIAGCGGKGGGRTAQIEGLAFDSVVIDTATHITTDPNSRPNVRLASRCNTHEGENWQKSSTTSYLGRAFSPPTISPLMGKPT